MEKRNILIVDDNKGFKHDLSNSLSKFGYSNFQVQSYREALDIYKSKEIFSVLLDLSFQDGYIGLNILRRFKEMKDIPVFISTDHSDVPTVVEAMQKGADGYFTKPLDLNKVISKFKELEESQMREKELIQSLTSHLGKSTFIEDILSNIKKAAKSQISLMIFGESGTGKFYLARLLNELSGFSKEQFHHIPVFPHTIEDILFGSDHNGLLETIKDGTIYLSGIQNIPPSCQEKLSLFLMKEDIPFRIISSSTVDIKALVNEKLFSSDLFYRLSVFDITIPPLRERQEDILYFSKKFTLEDSKKMKSNVKEISESALRLLSSHNWPGNMTELKAVIQRALTFSTSFTLSAKDFLFLEKPGYDNSIIEKQVQLQKPISLIQAEKEAILKALKYVAGNKTEAAKILELTRQALYNKIKKLQINENDYK